MKYLRFLRFGLAAILIFVGVKMCLPEEYKIPTGVALTVVGGILVLSVLASIVVPQKK